MRFNKTKTGDLLQVSECKENDVTFGVITIKLKERYINLAEAETVLIHFMQQLQPLFAIMHTTGVSATTKKACHTSALVDYWQDVERQDWKVKGWTNGRSMAVLYIKNIGNVPIAKEERFLNGTSFAGGNFRKKP
jgi:hypothetical protein